MTSILVVDDDPYIAELVTDVLESSGFQVDRAENGAVAIAKIQQQVPDLVVLDLMMPVMDGWEFMRQCRELPVGAATPILVMSAAQRPAAESFGGTAFLAKPFEMSELVEAVTSLTVGAR